MAFNKKSKKASSTLYVGIVDAFCIVGEMET